MWGGGRWKKTRFSRSDCIRMFQMVVSSTDLTKLRGMEGLISKYTLNLGDSHESVKQ